MEHPMDLEHGDGGPALMRPPKVLDYSLTGENARRAVELGLAEADWYQTPVPRAEMRRLLERKDGPALRDTLLWFGLIIACGAATVWLWPSGWAALPYLMSPRANTCRSTYPPTTRSVSAISTSPIPSPPSGNASTFSTSSSRTRKRVAATTTRSPATA